MLEEDQTDVEVEMMFDVGLSTAATAATVDTTHTTSTDHTFSSAVDTSNTTHPHSSTSKRNGMTLTNLHEAG